jgi:hypothetical protein
VEELEREWKKVAERLQGKKLSLDLRDLTYSDAAGKRVLREMFSQSRAELLTNSDWSQFLADEIRNCTNTHANGRV